MRKGGSGAWVGGVALLTGLCLGATPGWSSSVGGVGATARWEKAVERDSTALALVLRAAAVMGGELGLERIQRVRMEMMTQWQRTGFRDVPWTDRPSFERHYDVRDYTIAAWRNTRDFGSRSVVNVVRDSVAITVTGGALGPQSVAYVDERDELFAYTPDRLVLLLSDAPDLRVAGDTTLGGEPHALVTATLGGRYRSTVAFHAGTGLPTMLRFRAAHPNDFGLVSWGSMWVEVWYSNWRTFGEVSIPTQWDVLRVGRPYKRMTVLAAVLNPDFAPDSFAVSEDLRASFLAARGPMHDRTVDSVKVVRPGLVQLHGFGAPAGAVQVGDGWLLLEAGQTPLNLSRGRQALAGAGVGALHGAVVGVARPGNGGVVALVEEGMKVYTSPAAGRFARAMLENADVRTPGIEPVTRQRGLAFDGDAVFLEVLDLPDTPGSMVLHVPRLRWLYVPDALGPLDVRMALDRAASLGWVVEGVGTVRGLWTAVPPVAAGAPDREDEP